MTVTMDEMAPPIPEPLASVAARLANEGVPVRAIARCLLTPSEDVRLSLQEAIDVGTITAMPRDDWPPGVERGSRLPAFMIGRTEAHQVAACQKVFKITPLEAAFMMVLMKRDEADKATLHHVVETQRATRPNQPGDPDETDPKIVDVVICHLRRKIKPKAIKIVTLWGHGYYLDAASRKIAEDLIAGAITNGWGAAENEDDKRSS